MRQISPEQSDRVTAQDREFHRADQRAFTFTRRPEIRERREQREEVGHDLRVLALGRQARVQGTEPAESCCSAHLRQVRFGPDRFGGPVVPEPDQRLEVPVDGEVTIVVMDGHLPAF